MNNIFFTADLHFGHSNILKHMPERPFASEGLIKEHDEWLLDLWRSSVDKRDDIYILGDLTFLKSEDARHLLEKLPGRKYLVEGNHDGSIRAYHNYFTSVHQILHIDIKHNRCPFLEKTLRLSMCHYPMITWNHKSYGSVMLHGHCHGKLDEHNSQSPDLRFDVGIDGTLSRAIGKEKGSDFALIDIEHLYEYICAKAGSTDFESYAKASYKTGSL